MTDLNRQSETQQRQRAIRAAEGYLELMSMNDQGLGIDVALALPLANRVVESLKRIDSRPHQSYLFYLGGEACRLTHQFHEAIAWYQQSLELEPENIHCLLAVAWCYKRADQIDEAIDSMHIAIEYEPDQAICHYNLACYFAIKGKSRNAITFLAQAFELQPEYRKMVDNDPDFDLIRGDEAFADFLSPLV